MCKLREIEDELRPLVDRMMEGTNRHFTIESDVEERDGKMIDAIKFVGGLDDDEKWEDYFNDLWSIIDNLRDTFKMQLIRIYNDCFKNALFATYGIERKEHTEIIKNS